MDPAAAVFECNWQEVPPAEDPRSPLNPQWKRSEGSSVYRCADDTYVEVRADAVEIVSDGLTDAEWILALAALHKLVPSVQHQLPAVYEARRAAILKRGRRGDEYLPARKASRVEDPLNKLRTWAIDRLDYALASVTAETTALNTHQQEAFWAFAIRLAVANNLLCWSPLRGIEVRDAKHGHVWQRFNENQLCPQELLGEVVEQAVLHVTQRGCAGLFSSESAPADLARRIRDNARQVLGEDLPELKAALEAIENHRRCPEVFRFSDGEGWYTDVNIKTLATTDPSPTASYVDKTKVTYVPDYDFSKARKLMHIVYEDSSTYIEDFYARALLGRPPGKQSLLLNVGPGDSGKSCTAQLFIHEEHGIATVSHFVITTRSAPSRPRDDLVRALGTRLAVVDEIPRDTRLDLSSFKALQSVPQEARQAWGRTVIREHLPAFVCLLNDDVSLFSQGATDDSELNRVVAYRMRNRIPSQITGLVREQLSDSGYTDADLKANTTLQLRDGTRVYNPTTIPDVLELCAQLHAAKIGKATPIELEALKALKAHYLLRVCHEASNREQPVSPTPEMEEARLALAKRHAPMMLPDGAPDPKRFETLREFLEVERDTRLKDVDLFRAIQTEKPESLNECSDKTFRRQFIKPLENCLKNWIARELAIEESQRSSLDVLCQSPGHADGRNYLKHLKLKPREAPEN